ncbi:MAG: tetratricopeptide repeat protein [Planctomycetes bacterium]|nr:tetratricopeptide repeat protein [Planctomycetota bacterium]
MNSVLWALDNDLGGAAFERLCTDLLYREGYHDIVPIGGPHDRGRDAEIRTWRGSSAASHVTFFQFSLQKDWEGKLKRDLQKVNASGHKVDRFIFVTSQRVTGSKRDQLSESVARRFGWELIILDREWCRTRLEVAHPDLAVKYFGLALPPQKESPLTGCTPTVPAGRSGQGAWSLFSQQRFEEAAIEFKRVLAANPLDLQSLNALSWCEYALCRYDEAMISIDRCIKAGGKNPPSMRIKACILAESGLRNGSRPNLVLARDIFRKIAARSSIWADHYNLANTLAELGDLDGARREFLTALAAKPDEARVWKNLGSVYFRMRNHEEELRCYDRALAIEPRMSEALISKGVTLLTVFSRPKESIGLIRQAISSDATLRLAWPHAWYWLGVALVGCGELEGALAEIEAGLGIAPDHRGLLDLKARVLSRLWRREPGFAQQALEFFEFRTEAFPEDSESAGELARLYASTGQQQQLFRILAKYLECEQDQVAEATRLMAESLDQIITAVGVVPAYKRFRESSPISHYLETMPKEGIHPEADFEAVMFCVCAVPFGIGYATLVGIPLPEREKALGGVCLSIFQSLRQSMPRLAEKLVTADELLTKEQRINAMASVVAGWPYIALMEYSRQTGFLCGVLGLNDRQLKDQFGILDLGAFPKTIALAVVPGLNRKLKLFKE